jgi:hypothetical protein
MRRIALLVLLLSLTGCSGFGKFIGDTHTFRSDPNMPPGDSENMRRVSGQDSTQQALTPEPGNIWPPPAGPMPTLMDLEKQSPPTSQGAVPSPAPTVGSSSPPTSGLGAVSTPPPPGVVVVL